MQPTLMALYFVMPHRYLHIANVGILHVEWCEIQLLLGFPIKKHVYHWLMKVQRGTNIENSIKVVVESLLRLK